MGSRSKRIETFTEKKNCTQGVNTGNKKAGRDVILWIAKMKTGRAKKHKRFNEKGVCELFSQNLYKGVYFVMNPHITVLILYAKYFRSCIQASLDFGCL